MNRHELKQLLVQVLTDIQNNSGRAMPPVTDELKPLEDLEGFDSLNAEEAATMLSAVMGVDLADNPFVKGEQHLPISQIIDRLEALVGTKKEEPAHAKR